MAELRRAGTRNRLGLSDSLYLRQHRDNPVHWQPWDDEAFDLASTWDRPILLSIGYAAISPILLNHISRALADGIDTLYGGFGSDGPKFLHASGHELLLLRAWQRTGDAAYLGTVSGSVAQMASGAVFDHVGGGFHRYAVDDRWRVPHFEKMLNDNALTTRLLTQLWQATEAPLFAACARSTIGWLLREMRLPGGGFASSLAADSADGEGAFCLWTDTELRDALGHGAEALLGGFEAVADERLAGRLAPIRSFETTGPAHDDALDADLVTLRAVREQRDRPLRDAKRLADWNGLAVAALAEAGLAFDRTDWIAEAQTAFAATARSLGVGSYLAHSAAGGALVPGGMLDDYAAMALAALALHEATADPALLDQALGWEQVLGTQFRDDEAGGYFLTAIDAEQRAPRQKLIDETASPAGNGLMLGVLARLHALTGRDRFRHRFDDILRCFSDRMSRAGLQATTALCTGAWQGSASGPRRRLRLPRAALPATGVNAGCVCRPAEQPTRGDIVTSQLARMFNDRAGSLRGPIAGIYALLLLGNVAAWIWAVVVFRNQPVLLGTALLAYGFGLRHAVDADHIAAIDNVTRKLMQEGKRPVSVGLFFALGHSTVVVLVAAVIAASTVALQGTFEGFRDVGGVIATTVSTLFLFVIAAINLTVLLGVWRTYRHVRSSGVYQESDLDILLNQRGLLARLFRPLFRLITRSWHMLPLGFLFGLGFDTATEISVLGISATEAARGVSIWSIMVFPALFAAGMTLIDTTDGILMLGAYDWAYVKPMRKLYYNLTITSVSVVVAVVIGSIEGLRLIGGQLGLNGGFWTGVALLNDNFNTLGFIIVGLFIASWAVSALIYRVKRLDQVEVRLSP